MNKEFEDLARLVGKALAKKWWAIIQQKEMTRSNNGVTRSDRTITPTNRPPKAPKESSS